MIKKKELLEIMERADRKVGPTLVDILKRRNKTRSFQVFEKKEYFMLYVGRDYIGTVYLKGTARLKKPGFIRSLTLVPRSLVDEVAQEFVNLGLSVYDCQTLTVEGKEEPRPYFLS